MLAAAISPVLSAAAGQVAALSPASLAGHAASPQPGFFEALNRELKNVSAAQEQASVTEAGFAAGVPGDTLAKALVASDRAAVAWNATVAVRNELLAAYQSVMNMQF